MEALIYGFAVGLGSVAAQLAVRALRQWFERRRGGGKGGMVVVDW
jgi:hypothetical protein